MINNVDHGHVYTAKLWFSGLSTMAQSTTDRADGKQLGGRCGGDYVEWPP